mmetsp:Transcript_145493/g.464952  ORF Transcript_145493/g.464952 Transcript_145493/m.464952 type:complete len:848 (+) Transcript_145493:80-2623(+)
MAEQPPNPAMAADFQSFAALALSSLGPAGSAGIAAAVGGATSPSSKSVKRHAPPQPPVLLNELMKVHFYDGGVHEGRPQQGVENILKPVAEPTHSSSPGSKFNLVLECDEDFTLTHFFISGVAKSAESVRSGLVWVTDAPPSVEATKSFDALPADACKAAVGSASGEGGIGAPCAYFETTSSSPTEVEIELPSWASGKYLLIKFLDTHGSQESISIAFVALVGYMGRHVCPAEATPHGPWMRRSVRRPWVHGSLLSSTFSSGGWVCDGRDFAGGCRSGVTDFYQTSVYTITFRCTESGFDLCEACARDASMGRATASSVRADLEALVGDPASCHAACTRLRHILARSWSASLPTYFELGLLDALATALRGGMPAGPGSARQAAGSSSGGEFAAGTRVEAKYMLSSGRVTSRWYSGRVTGRNADGTYQVDYDDGDKWYNVPQDHVVRRGERPAAAPSEALLLPPRFGGSSSSSTARMLMPDLAGFPHGFLTLPRSLASLGLSAAGLGGIGGIGGLGGGGSGGGVMSKSSARQALQQLVRELADTLFATAAGGSGVNLSSGDQVWARIPGTSGRWEEGRIVKLPKDHVARQRRQDGRFGGPPPPPMLRVPPPPPRSPLSSPMANALAALAASGGGPPSGIGGLAGGSPPAAAAMAPPRISPAEEMALVMAAEEEEAAAAGAMDEDDEDDEEEDEDIPEDEEDDFSHLRPDVEHPEDEGSPILSAVPAPAAPPPVDASAAPPTPPMLAALLPSSLGSAPPSSGGGGSGGGGCAVANATEERPGRGWGRLRWSRGRPPREGGPRRRGLERQRRQPRQRRRPRRPRRLGRRLAVAQGHEKCQRRGRSSGPRP